MIERKPGVLAAIGFFLLGCGLLLVTYGTVSLLYIGYYAGKSTCPEATLK